MIARVSMSCLCLISALLLAWALPNIYDLALRPPIDKTHIFWSPMIKSFIYTEQIRGFDQQAAQLSEGHHADIVYKDATGKYYDRLSFEAALPFIYFRNMEMRGLLPVRIADRSIDRQEIEAARRVLELPARKLDSNQPMQNCLPLIESNPGQVALLYPVDRFEFEPTQMLFINADINDEDPKLTQRFTEALTKQGFTFPALHVGGNFTTFKAYESGIFIVDAKHKLFHLLRKDDQPLVTKIALPETVQPKHVLVSESKQRTWLGLMVAADNSVWLIHDGDFALTRLEVPNYLPETMDLKLLFDPVTLTVVTSDEKTVTASAFPVPQAGQTNLTPLHSFTHQMSRAMPCWQDTLASVLFPFRLSVHTENATLAVPHVTISAHWLTHALPLCLCLAFVWLISLRKSKYSRITLMSSSVFILLAGLFAFIPLLLLRDD